MNRLGSLVVLACGTTGLVYASVTPGQPAKGGADRFGPQLAKAYSALFNDMDLVSKGKFGVARDPLANTHLRGDNEPQFPTQLRVQALLDRISGAGFSLEEGLFAPQRWIAPKGVELAVGSPQSVQPVGFSATWLSANPSAHQKLLFLAKYSLQGQPGADLERFASDSFSKAKRRPFLAERAGYQLYSFPVKFEHKECISCHANAKLHQTAAVLTFAFKKA